MCHYKIKELVYAVELLEIIVSFGIFLIRSLAYVLIARHSSLNSPYLSGC